jgi:hypothetical protein
MFNMWTRRFVDANHRGMRMMRVIPEGAFIQVSQNVAQACAEFRHFGRLEAVEIDQRVPLAKSGRLGRPRIARITFALRTVSNLGFDF